MPCRFADHLRIPNAQQRFDEALAVAGKITEAGVRLLPNLDHAAIFTDPPLLVAGPLKRLGYVSGWDARCYPSPVDGHDYINVSAKLPDGCAARGEGWPMEGGGLLLQFFVLTGGRIELALRVGTKQTFNPKSLYVYRRSLPASSFVVVWLFL